MSTFKCDYATLRKVAGDFIKELPTVTNLDVLDAGLKCVQLHYLGMEVQYPHEVVGAAAVLRIVTREYLTVEASLME